MTIETPLPAFDPLALAGIPTGSDGHIHYGRPHEAPLCEPWLERVAATVDWEMVDCKVCRWRGEGTDDGSPT